MSNKLLRECLQSMGRDASYNGELENFNGVMRGQTDAVQYVATAGRRAIRSRYEYNAASYYQQQQISQTNDTFEYLGLSSLPGGMALSFQASADADEHVSDTDRGDRSSSEGYDTGEAEGEFNGGEGEDGEGGEGGEGGEDEGGEADNEDGAEVEESVGSRPSKKRRTSMYPKMAMMGTKGVPPAGKGRFC